jgi:collagen triple helix repeat protein
MKKKFSRRHIKSFQFDTLLTNGTKIARVVRSTAVNFAGPILRVLFYSALPTLLAVALVFALSSLVACAPQPEVRVVTGPKGDQGSIGTPGRNGNDGTDGHDGRDGVDGRDGTNGRDGIDGAPGRDAVAIQPYIVGSFDPCGNTPGKFDEIFFVTFDGKYIASCSKNFSGDYTRLCVVEPGSWTTTDETNCHFTIDSDGTYHE